MANKPLTDAWSPIKVANIFAANLNNFDAFVASSRLNLKTKKSEQRASPANTQNKIGAAGLISFGNRR